VWADCNPRAHDFAWPLLLLYRFAIIGSLRFDVLFTAIAPGILCRGNLDFA
jgi:hypothetical protein